MILVILCFSALHCNIRSLSANSDNLLNMISELYYSFSLIGLIETKLKVDQPHISNIDILGYQFISQPSHSMAGGVGFYVKNSLSYKVRTDLTTSKDEFEALWIEIQNKGKANIICGVVYTQLARERLQNVVRTLHLCSANVIIERCHNVYLSTPLDVLYTSN